MDADLILPPLRANLHAMRAIATYLRGAKDKDDIVVAFKDMGLITDSTISLLKEIIESFNSKKGLGNSRLPHRGDVPLSSAEVLEALQTSVALMALEAEMMLGRSVNELSDEEFADIKRKSDVLIGAIGSTARYYKKSIVDQYPGFWTDILEKQFEIYLKMRPPG